MSEFSTKDNEETVSRIYEAAMNALHRGEPVGATIRLIHDIEHMMQEVNSGASFEQYFRWASVEELTNIQAHLLDIDLDGVAALVGQAIGVAFPDGIPTTEEEKSAATEWSADQETVLSELFEQLEKHNGRVTNALGTYAMRVGA